jgi:hypothetical protein
LEETQRIGRAASQNAPTLTPHVARGKLDEEQRQELRREAAIEGRQPHPSIGVRGIDRRDLP